MRVCFAESVRMIIGQAAAERADTLERKLSDELDLFISKSALFHMADGELDVNWANVTQRGNKRCLMGDDPRLPKMPEKPTLLDFFKYRTAGTPHLLQSAMHALNAGMPETTVVACLLHDIANAMFIKSDHGY